jgi:hypothetical protein
LLLGQFRLVFTINDGLVVISSPEVVRTLCSP